MNLESVLVMGVENKPPLQKINIDPGKVVGSEIVIESKVYMILRKIVSNIHLSILDLYFVGDCEPCMWCGVDTNQVATPCCSGWGCGCGGYPSNYPFFCSNDCHDKYVEEHKKKSPNYN